MNKFSTLFASLCSLLIASSASAQIAEGFSSQTEVDALAASCWTFSNTSFSNNSSSIDGVGSLLTSLNTRSRIITPDLQAGSSITVSFNYKHFTTKPGSKPIRVFTELNGVETVRDNGTNINSTPSGTYSLTFTVAPGMYKLIIDVSENVSLFVDDLTINTSYAYPGGCAPVIDPITLPIKLINFQGSINNNKGQLKWAVADNETGDHFQVMRSTDGRNFTEAGTVFINGKVGAESYSFSDALELAATTFYQLKIVNKNGSIAYSNIITLKSAAAKQAASLTILQNPVAATLNFSYAATSAGQTNLSIYTTSGVKVYSNRISSVKGTNAVSLPLDRHIAPGTYILEVSNGTERNVAKMVKQ
jgi:hypothetical protein